MTESEKVVILIRDAIAKRPEKFKASFGPSSDKDSEANDNKRIPFSKFYQKKLMEKLNRKRDEPYP